MGVGRGLEGGLQHRAPGGACQVAGLALQRARLRVSTWESVDAGLTAAGARPYQDPRATA